MYPFPRTSLEIDGFRYTYATAGEPKLPPLLFLHNGGSDHRRFHYQLRDLSKEFHCIALDIPGFGESSRPDIPFTIEWLTEKTEAFMEAMFGHRPIDVVGLCIGGTIASKIARSSPSRITRLTLVNFCGGRPSFSGPLRFFEQWIPKRGPFLTLVIGLTRAPPFSAFTFRGVLRDLFLDPSRLEKDALAIERDISKQSHISSRKNLFRGMPTFAEYSQNFPDGTLRMPVQLLWGRTNRVVTPEFGEKLAKILHTPMIWMEKSRHAPMVEEHERFNEIVRRFHGRS